MNAITEIPLLSIGGFSAGHAQNEEAATGCTVLLFDRCSPAGVDVRGLAVRFQGNAPVKSTGCIRRHPRPALIRRFCLWSGRRRRGHEIFRRTEYWL